MDKEILHRYFSDSATVEEERLVLDWLEASPENFREMLSEREIYDTILMHVEPAEEAPKKIKLRKPFTKTLTAIAGYAAAVLIGAGVWGLFSLRPFDNNDVAMNVITVPSGQSVEIMLSDGTSVHMNALSRLEYPATFDKKQRNVRLSGEAYFNVARNEKVPFVVETERCDIEVLGTEFNVEAYDGTGKFSTSLVNGSVRVTDRSDPINKVVLSPKECLTYNEGRFAITDIPEHESFQWRKGIMSFRSTPFVDLLKELERYYGVSINLDNADLPDKTFSGKIRINEGVEHALKILQNTHEFDYVWNETHEVIYVK